MGLGEHYRFLFFHCLSPESRGTPSPSSRECFNLEESVMEQKVTHVISRKPVIHVQVSWPHMLGFKPGYQDALCDERWAQKVKTEKGSRAKCIVGPLTYYDTILKNNDVDE